MAFIIILYSSNDYSLAESIIGYNDTNSTLASTVRNCQMILSLEVLWLHTPMPFPRKRFCEHKNATCTMTDIFQIKLLVISRPHGERLLCLSKHLINFLIHAYHLVFHRKGVHKHPEHPPYKLQILRFLLAVAVRSKFF